MKTIYSPLRSQVCIQGLLGLLFLTSLFCRPLHAETEYMAVLIDGRKVGHAEMTRQEADDRVTTAMRLIFSLARGQTPLTITTSESNVETRDGKPISFRSEMDMGIMSQTTEGTVKNGQIDLKITTGGVSQSKTMPWPEGALMSEGARLAQLQRGLKEGARYPLKMFEINMLQALDTEVIVGPTKEVDLLGRVVKLTEVLVNINLGSGQVATTSYVDNDWNVQKMVMSMMGIKLELIACGREFAMSPHDLVDLFDKFILRSPTPIPDSAQMKSVVFLLALDPQSATEKLNLPETDSQKVKPDKPGSWAVTVTVPTWPGGETFPYRGNDPGALASLKPTRYIESDRKLIVDLAKKAVGDAKDAAEAVKRIETFVADYIAEKDLSVGYATAAEVAESKQGDCTEHSVLATALCRAVGVPARVAHGLVYVDHYAGQRAVFVPHAWSQAFVGGRWIDFDAALNGFTAGHLTLSAGPGEPKDFFSVVTSLGSFKITRIELKK